MANYVKATNFAVKDSLASGNPAKIVKGTEIDTEFNAIASAVASKVDADSPTFTGTPLTPTPSTATNNTQIASTAYVVNRITQDIVAPLALKANIASPTFTGTPAAPTPATEDNSTKLATTAYVVNKINAIAAGVTSFSTGTTGLTPSASTTGAVTLGGTLNLVNGGTGATTAANARTNLDVPSRSGADASGTWGINITGNAATATNATTVTTVTAAQVLTGTAGASVGAVGTYAFLYSPFVATYNPGDTLAGSSLRYAGVAGGLGSVFATLVAYSSSFPSGTWRCMGFSSIANINDTNQPSATLWLRIS